MLKLTKSVVRTVRELAEQNTAGSPEMRKITFSVVREQLRDEHGIRLPTKIIRRLAEVA